MARLVGIRYTPHTRVGRPGGDSDWLPSPTRSPIDGLPQLFWSSGQPWREANCWALDAALCSGIALSTVQTNMAAILAYANWLEATETNWWDLPTRKADRCLVRFRGALIISRDSGHLAASTVSHRMRVVVRLYRWLHERHLVRSSGPLWQERSFGIRLSNTFGLERTILGRTTDLAIPNRSGPTEKLEGGLLPVTSEFRDSLLEIAQDRCSEELFLMLKLGFFTGMRLGTISSLDVRTLDNAVRDPAAPKLFRLAVGPAASPPVATKFGVTGQIWILEELLVELRAYARSTRRLLREGAADPSSKNLLFLTRFGNPYAQRGVDKSPAINVELHRLRQLASAVGLTEASRFRFHQTRCTFATELAHALLALKVAGNPVAVVKEALLHKNESTSLRYIRFVERSAQKREVANAFTRSFFGTLGR